MERRASVFPYCLVRSELKVKDGTLCDWASFCREVFIEWLLKRVEKMEVREDYLHGQKVSLGKENMGNGHLVVCVKKLVKDSWCLPDSVTVRHSLLS